MPEPQEGVNSDQTAADQNGVVGAAATNNSVGQEVAAGQSVTQAQPAGGQQQANQSATGTEQTAQQQVPYDRFKEVNDAKNALALENEQLKAYAQGIQASGNVTQQQQAQQQQQGLAMQVMKEKGFDTDYITPEQNAEVIDEVVRRTQQASMQVNQYQNFVASKSDFADIVGTTNPLTGQFVFAQPAIDAMNKNPMVAQSLNGLDAARTAVLLYGLVKNSVTQQQANTQQANAQQAINNAQQTIQQANTQQSISSVTGTNGVIDKGAQIQAMSDADFATYKNSVISNA
jgi:hypothetical protein